MHTLVTQKIRYALFLIIGLSFAQQSPMAIELDSLWAHAKSHSKTQLDSAQYYAHLAYKKALVTRDQNLIAKAAFHESSYLIHLKEFDKAQQLLESSLKQNAILNHEQLGNIYLNLGAIDYLMEAYDKALDHYFNAIEYYKLFSFDKGLAKAYLQVGVIYEKKQQMSMADYFYQLSLDHAPNYAQSHHTDNLPSVLSFEKKIAMSLKMLENSDLAKDPKQASIIYYNLATSYVNIEAFEQALDAALQSLRLKEAVGFKNHLDVTYAVIGKCYLRTGQSQKAIPYLLEAQAMTHKRHLQTQIYQFLIEAYTAQNSYKLALDTSLQFSKFKDSIHQINEGQKIAALTAKFEHEQQEKAILRLEQDNSEKALVLAQQEKKLWRTTALVTILVLLMFWLVRLYMRSLKRARKLKSETQRMAETVQQPSILLNNKKIVHLELLKYIQSEGNYLKFYHNLGKTIDRHKLKDVLRRLPPNFIRVHRSFIVNKNHISAINSTRLTLKSGEEIPISRTFKHNLSI